MKNDGIHLWGSADDEGRGMNDDEEGDDYLALADSAIVVPTVEPVSPPEGTEPVIPPPSTDITTIGARITVRHFKLSYPFYQRQRGAPVRCMAPICTFNTTTCANTITTYHSGCSHPIQTLRIASTQALVDAVTAALPSPPLPPLPPSLYIPPLVDRKDDIPESERPPSKGLSQATYQELQTHRDRVYAYETHIQAHQAQLQLQSTLIQTQHQVYETRFQMQQAEMAALRRVLTVAPEHRWQETLRPGPGARIPDHQDASGDANNEEEYPLLSNTNPNNLTPESVQAMIDQSLQRNSTNGDASHSSHGDDRRNVQTARPCFYVDFMKCQPLNFKGTEGVVGLTRWIEKMESVFNISGCAIKNNQVKVCHLHSDRFCHDLVNGQIKNLSS
ncbi:hypothetical protein Tco_1175866 [Tanacetum coccineum]